MGSNVPGRSAGHSAENKVIVTGKNPGLKLTDPMWLDTHDRIEYVPGCVVIFAFFNARYVLIDRIPKGAPNPGKDNPVRLFLGRDRRTRKQRRGARRMVR